MKLMNILAILQKFLVLVAVAGLGGLLYALSANIFIMAGMMPTEAVDTAPGYQMTQQAVYSWMISVLISILAAFLIKSRWRWILVLSPIYVPTTAALIFLLTH